MTHRIGLIVPSSNTTMETELPELFRRQTAATGHTYTFHSARAALKNVTTEELLAMAAKAADCATAVSDADVDVIAYACLVAVMALSLSVAGLFTGCVSNKYKMAKSGTALPQLLNVAFASAPLEASLNSVITFNGPGSWKRDAFWDEYVVTLHNPGNQPLTITTAGLTDFAGLARTAGGEPWALENESKTLERKYKDAGMAFVRYTAPGVIILGAGASAVASAGIFAATPVLATASLVALPI